MGVAHLTEHVLMRVVQRGIGHRPVRTNAHTGYFWTGFVMEEPERSDVSKFLLEIESLGEEIDEDTVEKERRVVISEIRKSLNSPTTYISKYLVQRSAYEGRLAHPIVGYEETVRDLDVEDVRSWFDRLTASDDLLLEYWEEDSYQYTPRRLSISFTRRDIVEEREGLKGYYMALVWTGESSPALWTLSNYLSGWDGPLWQRLRQIGNYAPQFIVRMVPSARSLLIFQTFAPFTSEDKVQEAKNLILDEIDKIKEGSVDEEVFRRTRELLKLGAKKYRTCIDLRSTASDTVSFLTYGKPFADVMEEATRVSVDGVVELAQSLDKERFVLLVPVE